MPADLADTQDLMDNPIAESQTRIAQSTSTRLTPTQETYKELQDAYVFFNRRLFDGTLPDCLITMQRHARTFGFFCYARFVNTSKPGERTHEIALNPSYFAERTEFGVCSTLVHEMVHLWQFHTHDFPRRGYHNRKWADRMIAVGLYPTDTGEPGGSETGYRMTHYIVKDGLFHRSCKKLLAAGFRFSWLEDAHSLGVGQPVTAKATPGRTDSSNRWKYTCSSCGLNAWAKPDARPVCGFCAKGALNLMKKADTTK